MASLDSIHEYYQYAQPLKFSKRKEIQMESNCCNARPFFALGYIHGIKMAENGTYYGICGECKEHAEFNKQEAERESNGADRLY